MKKHYHKIDSIEELINHYRKYTHNLPGIQFNEVTLVTGINVVKGYHKANNQTLLKASVVDSINHLLRKTSFGNGYILSNKAIQIIERQLKINNILNEQ